MRTAGVGVPRGRVDITSRVSGSARSVSSSAPPPATGCCDVIGIGRRGGGAPDAPPGRGGVGGGCAPWSVGAVWMSCGCALAVVPAFVPPMPMTVTGSPEPGGGARGGSVDIAPPRDGGVGTRGVVTERSENDGRRSPVTRAEGVLGNGPELPRDDGSTANGTVPSGRVAVLDAPGAPAPSGGVREVGTAPLGALAAAKKVCSSAMSPSRFQPSPEREISSFGPSCPSVMRRCSSRSDLSTSVELSPRRITHGRDALPSGAPGRKTLKRWPQLVHLTVVPRSETSVSSNSYSVLHRSQVTSMEEAAAGPRA